MVQVTQIQTPVDANDQNYQAWHSSLLPNKSDIESELWTNLTQLLQSVSMPSQQNKLGLFKQSFEMANILFALNASSSTLVAATLYPFVEQQLIPIEKITDTCGDKVAKRIAGITSMNAIRALQPNYVGNNDVAHIDNLRKMLLTMVDDVQVVLIKLAERLFFLRQAVLVTTKKSSIQIAHEISDIYAPLANRLGVGQIKWEMEDLSFRILKNTEYKMIAKSLAEKRSAREVYVTKVLETIRDALGLINIEGDLQGRAKHIYSIWKKMQRKQIGFEDIYDMRAVRVLVPKIQDCYSVLGVVHGLWKHIPKEFDDYIATPKENGYRSLHTAVIGPEGKTLEIQIRTTEMHQESELGVAAHWKYKEGKTATDSYESKITWLRQLLEWQDEVTEVADIAEEFRNQVIEERIYIFTPQGKLIDLPRGSTAIDFAYRVHTEVGHRCRGAKVNGRIISLSQTLQTGQKVEILTAKNGEPSRDWLSEHHGYVKSSRARHKISQWFRHQDKDKNAAAGKHLLDKELSRQSLHVLDFNKLSQHFNYNKQEELFAGIGVGDNGLNQVINAIRLLQNEPKPSNQNNLVPKKAKITKRTASSDILVEGVGNLLTRTAGCCKPVPGDEIVGYVSQGRGIMIHRSDCGYLKSSQKKSPKNILAVEWTHSLNENYLVDLLIKAYDRQGLLGDVTTVVADEKLSVTSVKMQVNKKRLMINIHLQLEVPSAEMISRVMSKIEHLPTVISVHRK